jgi:hypothetical protein
MWGLAHSSSSNRVSPPPDQEKQHIAPRASVAGVCGSVVYQREAAIRGIPRYRCAGIGSKVAAKPGPMPTCRHPGVPLAGRPQEPPASTTTPPLPARRAGEGRPKKPRRQGRSPAHSPGWACPEGERHRSAPLSARVPSFIWVGFRSSGQLFFGVFLGWCGLVPVFVRRGF